MNNHLKEGKTWALSYLLASALVTTLVDILKKQLNLSFKVTVALEINAPRHLMEIF